MRSLQATLAKKNMTPAGEGRKSRIVKKLFEANLQTKLVLNLFLSVLPLLQEYVKLFQSDSPLVHKLFDKQLELVKNFLGCFIKPEILKKVGNSTKKIRNLDLKNKENHLLSKNIFIGDQARQLISLAPRSSINLTKSFQEAMIQAYISCTETLIKKMPISNYFLKAASAIDPACRQHYISLHLMKELPSLVTNVIAPEKKESFEMEVHNYHSDSFLRSVSRDERIDEWWIALKKTNSYPLLTEMVCSILTCFHGPRVESSFSIMNSIITPGSSRMNVSTFNAIQSVKYHLMGEKKSAVEYFAKKDFLHEPVNKRLVQNLKSSHSSYKEELAAKRQLNKKKVRNSRILKKKLFPNKQQRKFVQMQ